MASEHTGDEDSGCGFGAGESRQAKASQPPRKSRLGTVHRTARSGRESSGNDPYNTSGSFDRSRNWARVGKR